MKFEEYMDPDRFPLTTQEGLGIRDQLRLDAFKLDMAEEMQENGKPFNEKQAAVFEELKEKDPYIKDMTDTVNRKIEIIKKEIQAMKDRLVVDKRSEMDQRELAKYRKLKKALEVLGG